MAETIDLGVDHLTDLELLGRGGFSVVYAATDTRFDRRVAVKVLNKLIGDADQRRFERECRVMGRLSSHPNVVTVYESGSTPDGFPFLVMELVTGGSLQDRIEGGPIRWDNAISLTTQVADALAHAHDSDVVHRDVKPENILVAGDVVKLTDFGISSFINSTGAASSTIAASWQHAPPETFSNTRDEVSDVYSLGSTLYTMLSGRPPLWRDGEESVEPLMYRIINEPAPHLPAGVGPNGLDDLVQRTLAKDPAGRPQSAREFAEQLGQIRTGSYVAPATSVVGPPVAVPSVSGSADDPVDAPPIVASGVVAPGPAAPVSRRWLVAIGGAVVAAAVLAGAWFVAREPSADTTAAATTTSPQVTEAEPANIVTAANNGLDDESPDGAAEETTDPTPTTQPSTSPTTTPTTPTTITTEAPADEPGEQIPTYEATVSSGTSDVDGLNNFVFGNEGAIVRLDVTVIQSAGDFFSIDETVGVQLYGPCNAGVAEDEMTVENCDGGYYYNFLQQSAGTSAVSRGREGTRISGYFVVGSDTFFNQGILAVPLDPITLEAALAATN